MPSDFLHVDQEGERGLLPGKERCKLGLTHSYERLYTYLFPLPSNGNEHKHAISSKISIKCASFRGKSSMSLTLSASGPVIATILRIPLEMASSEMRENAFM